MNVNKVFLAGRLTRDPVLRRVGEKDTAVVNVGVATNRRWRNQDGEWVEKVTFVELTVWGARGEAFHKHHSKGDPFFIEGHLEFEEWEDRESGEARSKLKVTIDDWQLAKQKGDQP